MTFRQGPPAEPSTATAFESISLPFAAANGAFGNRNGFAHQFADHHVSQVARLVDQSGIIATLDQWRTADAIERHAGGRSAVLNDRALIVAMLLLALDGKGILITRIAELLQHRLTDDSKAILGIDNASGGSFVEWNNRAWHAFHRITVLIDGYETPRRSRLTREQFALIEKNRTANAANLTFKQKRLDWFCNQLLETTLQLLPRRVRRRWKGSISFDATFTQAFARGTRNNSPVCSIEPDAAWYVREGDHRDTPPPDSKKPLRKSGYGWETTIAITTNPNETKFPYLAVAMTFDKPGFNIANNARTLVSSLIDRKHPAGYAIADRAYFPNSKPEQLQLPLREAGYKLVFDYREDQLGIIATHKGAILVEGNWYCPSMPTALIAATIDYRSRTNPITEHEYGQRIKQRPRYLLKPKQNADADGYQVWSCPAVGDYATVACDLKPESVKSPRAAGRTRIPVASLPSHPDDICKQKSVTFTPTAAAKYVQPLHYKSEQWQHIYATGRNAMEGFNGYLKDPNRNTIAAPGLRRVRGRAAQQLVVAFLIAAANIAKIRQWLEQNPDDKAETAPLVASTRQKRRKHSIKTFSMRTSDPPIVTEHDNRH